MLTLLRANDYRQMPWKNGGGTTCELFRLPHPHRTDDFALRISIATVSTSGPFSAFPGVDRQLMLLDGSGMVLTMPNIGDIYLTTALQPIEFAGEIPVDCRLVAGSIHDFNLMVARDWGTATLLVQRFANNDAVSLPASELRFVYVVTGALQNKGQVCCAGESWMMAAEALEATCAMATTVILIEAQAIAAV